MRRFVRLLFVFFLILGLLYLANELLRTDNPIARAEQKLKLGERVYRENCTACHGEKGDGKGPQADRLKTKPRDFTGGIYKFRSTPSGSLPLDSDLARTITRGVRGTAMLAPTPAIKRGNGAGCAISQIILFSVSETRRLFRRLLSRRSRLLLPA